MPNKNNCNIKVLIIWNQKKSITKPTNIKSMKSLHSIIILPHVTTNIIPFLNPFSIFFLDFPLYYWTLLLVFSFASRLPRSPLLIIESKWSTPIIWLWIMQQAKTSSTCVGNDQKGFASNSWKCFFKTQKQHSMLVGKEEWQRL